MRKRLKKTGFALFFLSVIALVAVEASEGSELLDFHVVVSILSPGQ